MAASKIIFKLKCLFQLHLPIGPRGVPGSHHGMPGARGWLGVLPVVLGRGAPASRSRGTWGVSALGSSTLSSWRGSGRSETPSDG